MNPASRRRLIISTALVGGALIPLGLLLATFERRELVGCGNPCDPGSTLPYAWPGLILLSGGVLICLYVCALGLAAWRRRRAVGSAATGAAVAFLGVGAFGFSASLALAVVGAITPSGTGIVVLMLPWIGFFGVLALIGLRWLLDRNRHAKSI